jgi:TetR/AcrR family transcriptional regulator, regulator of cefoperazone and chloramphenicol sensitivity
VASSNTKPTRLSPSSRDKEARMRAMTDAAVALFSEEGYAAVTTRRIAERAGCSETLLFRYFGDKHGLLLAVCNGLWDQRADQRAARINLPDFPTLHEFLEYYFLAELSDLRIVAPPLKVVIAALINDPDMTSDFGERHQVATERVAKALRRFQDMGAISPDIDIDALAEGVEQLAFAIGFFLQLVFNRPEAKLESIARTVAAALSNGVQGAVVQPLLEPSRRKAVAAVIEARESLDDIIELLQEGDLAGTAMSGNGARLPSSRSKR